MAVPVQLIARSGAIQARIRGVSGGGLLVSCPNKTANKIVLGEDISVSFTPPGQVDECELEATVAWTRAMGSETTTLGLRFRVVKPSAESTLRDLAANDRKSVLVVHGQPNVLALIEGALSARYEVISSRTGEESLKLFAELEVAVLIIGDPPDMSRQELLAEVGSRFPSELSTKILLSAGDERSSEAAIFYRVKTPFTSEALFAIVESAAVRYDQNLQRTWVPSAGEMDPARAIRMQSVLSATRRLSLQSELQSVSALATESVEELVDADRAWCLLYDAESETLWTRRDDGEEQRTKAVGGIIGFVTRTRRPIRIDEAGADPRYDPLFDAPFASPLDRLLLAPIIGRDERLLVMLVASKPAAQRPFSPEDIEVIDLFAHHSGTAFEQVALQSQLQEILARSRAEGPKSPQLYRRVALDRYSQRSISGEPLEIPQRMEWLFRLCVAIVVAAVVFAFAVSVGEYATGPAVVRVEGRVELTSASSGIVSDIVITPGDRVARGQLLVRLYDAQQVAELRRTSTEFEAALVKLLLEPGNAASQEAVAKARTLREFAAAGLEQRAVYAPEPGVVADVRARTGQFLNAGDVVLALTREQPNVSVVAVMPGQYRPLLQRGMPLRFEVSGFRFAAQDMTVSSVADEVIGPAEVKRFLGPDVADAILVEGPVFLVTSTSDVDTFVAEGRTYRFHDGMSGSAEMRVREDRIIFMLFPALKAWWEGRHRLPSNEVNFGAARRR